MRICTVPVYTLEKPAKPVPAVDTRCLIIHTREHSDISLVLCACRALRKAVDIYTQLEGHLQALGLPIKSCGNDSVPVCRALTAGRIVLHNCIECCVQGWGAGGQASPRRGVVEGVVGAGLRNASRQSGHSK